MLRTIAFLFAAVPALLAQDVRELSTPVGQVTLLGVATSTISNSISGGYRLVDLEYRGPNILGTVLYDAVLVQNTGAYAAGWWWYTGQTAAQVSSNLAANQARLIDLEPYEDANGNLRFACVMVDNTGVNQKAWWWYYGQTTGSLSTQVSTNGARLVDVDSYDLNGTTYYSGVMIANTGGDARGWWWYLNVTAAQVGANLSANSAQLYDLERRSNGNWDCVMIQNPTPAASYWWYGLSSADVGYLLGQYGVRPITIETYLSGSTRYWAMVTINNSNALTTSIGNAMRARTDGQVGCWLQQINGSSYANLNGDTQFEPASAMKVLHHTHAMRWVSLGLSLSTPLTVYTGYSGSCPQDTGAFTQQLQGVLPLMMENSDNARTQAVRAYFGESSLNNTAAALGMASTASNHRLGCGAEAIANPNRITLRDLHALHTAVANGYLGSQRALFYQMMLDSVFDLNIASVIAQEGASLGLSSGTVASFRNLTEVAHKGGNYNLSSGGPAYNHRAEFGWLSLPFLVNDVLTPREFGFGAFVNNAGVDADAVTAIYTDAIPELLRPRIRAALQTWTNSLATVAAFGAGCGGYQQTVNGLPRLGTNVTYNGVNGYASAIALFGIGFSNTSWSGIPLPASLLPFGGGLGCVALNDLQITSAGIANASGGISFGVSIPAPLSGIGFEYYTQFYSFGPVTFRTSNGQHSTVGL
ncbi:MAG: serine hydrolase [Planctomycetota bacterium]